LKVWVTSFINTDHVKVVMDLFLLIKNLNFLIVKNFKIDFWRNLLNLMYFNHGFTFPLVQMGYSKVLILLMRAYVSISIFKNVCNMLIIFFVNLFINY